MSHLYKIAIGKTVKIAAIHAYPPQIWKREFEGCGRDG